MSKRREPASETNDARGAAGPSGIRSQNLWVLRAVGRGGTRHGQDQPEESEQMSRSIAMNGTARARYRKEESLAMAREHVCYSTESDGISGLGTISITEEDCL